MSFLLQQERGQLTNPAPKQEAIPMPSVEQEPVEQLAETLAQTETVEEQVVDNASTTEETEPVEVAKPVTPQESFRQLRELREKAERERDEALKMAYDMQQWMMKQQQPQQEKSPEEPEMDPEELVSASQVKKLLKQQETYNKQQQQQMMEMMTEQRLKAEYPDIDKVVSKDNMKMLEAMEPVLHSAIKNNSDFYTKAVSAYKLIQKLGIYQDQTLINRDIERTQKNVAKPRPLNSISAQQGNSPLDKANPFAEGLTPALIEKLRKEMNEARKTR